MNIETSSSQYALVSSYQSSSGSKESEPSVESSVKKMQSQSSADEAKVREQVMKLQAVDSDVRAHEAAHIAAGGGVVTGGANFSYTRGPDGKMYATGGEVPIDTSKEDTPEATAIKARKIVAAALAPANPSPQDYKVAATAMMMESRAMIEIAKEKQEEIEGLSAYGQSSSSSDEDVSITGEKS
ncbi:MAG: putative metalloprotease CJM1_0395 family protein [Campylobacterota bacterium]|nr:putative metalloprotease CJM1_0395 family protein [Campylobacterota bacterium]